MVKTRDFGFKKICYLTFLKYSTLLLCGMAVFPPEFRNGSKLTNDTQKSEKVNKVAVYSSP